ncbi:PAS domain-containing protein [Ferrovibrio sp.]|uniref:PAS domain-containing protein n=1 Tax=Ferrovibrio sp. TaxID=1917215 RepID=UPI000CC8EC8F|nr:PAS domain-containing protein [Ferrovibrio sp.]PJI38945.1 MAG: hypothetical protein CTR53_13535 [Ferrovibrio sp.]
MSCPEELRSLEAFWHMKRGGRALPRRSDFTPEELRPWLGNLAIIAVERDMRDMRFRVALSGTQLDSYRGHGITGRYVDEVCSGIEDTTPYYRDCVTRGMPVHYLHDNSPNSAIYTDMGKMLLPLSEDGVTVDRILVAMYPLPANDSGCDTYAMAG